MSELSATISGYVVGDDLEVRRTITGLPAAITDAWMTIKHHAGQTDDQAILQKHITTADQPGTGQVVTAGGPEEDGDLRFDCTPANTTALGFKPYVYDIQVLLSGGKIYTVEKGTLQLTGQVTRSTS